MKRLKSLYGLLSILFFFSVTTIFYSCNNRDKNTIQLSATLDLTGSSAPFGQKAKDGIELAVKEINSNGGINGKKIKLTVLNSGSDSRQAINNLHRFLNVDHSKFIIGPVSSSVALTMIPVIEKNGAFLFSPVASSYKLSNISKNFARNWPSDNAEAGFAAKFAIDSFHAKSAIIVYSDNAYGTGLKKAFEKGFKQNGGRVIKALPFQEGTTNFKTLISKIRILEADCMYLDGNSKDMGVFMRQFGQYNMKIPIITNVSFSQPECYKTAGKSADGIVIPSPSYLPNDPNNIVAQRFTKNFEKAYGFEPTLVAANGYDIVKILAQGIKKFGYNPIKVAKFVRNLKDYKGAAGILSFKNGDVIRSMAYKTIQNGNLVDYNK